MSKKIENNVPIPSIYNEKIDDALTPFGRMKKIGDSLNHLIERKVKWRMIIATFSSLISRIQQIIIPCEEHGKQVFLSWRSMIENVRIARELGFIKVKPGTIKKMSSKSTEWVPDDKQVIITTWSQWEEFSALSRMAAGTHPALTVQPWDTIVLSSTPIPLTYTCLLILLTWSAISCWSHLPQIT